MSAQPLKLLSSMAARELLAELAREYQRGGGPPVDSQAAGGVDVARRVQAGEPVDVVVLSRTAIDKLEAEGKTLAGSRRDLASSGVAVAVAVGAPRPDISTESTLKAAVLAARSLAYSTGPSGVHLEKTFARWGILEAIRDRIRVAPPGVPVGSLLARGEAELGFQQLSELMSLPGVQVLGPLPEPVQTLTLFSGAIGARSRRAEEAHALLEFLAAPAALAAKKRYGMQAP